MIKRVPALLVAAGIAAAAAGSTAMAGSEESTTPADSERTMIVANDKITICHIPPGNPANAHTITISASALHAHLAHGDPVGPCVSGGGGGDGGPPLPGMLPG